MKPEVNAQDIRERSRRQYARPRSDVEAEIQAIYADTTRASVGKDGKTSQANLVSTQSTQDLEPSDDYEDTMEISV